MNGKERKRKRQAYDNLPTSDRENGYAEQEDGGPFRQAIGENMLTGALCVLDMFSNLLSTRNNEGMIEKLSKRINEKMNANHNERLESTTGRKRKADSFCGNDIGSYTRGGSSSASKTSFKKGSRPRYNELQDTSQIQFTDDEILDEHEYHITQDSKDFRKETYGNKRGKNEQSRKSETKIRDAHAIGLQNSKSLRNLQKVKNIFKILAQPNVRKIKIQCVQILKKDKLLLRTFLKEKRKLGKRRIPILRFKGDGCKVISNKTFDNNRSLVNMTVTPSNADVRNMTARKDILQAEEFLDSITLPFQKPENSRKEYRPEYLATTRPRYSRSIPNESFLSMLEGGSCLSKSPQYHNSNVSDPMDPFPVDFSTYMVRHHDPGDEGTSEPIPNKDDCKESLNLLMYPGKGQAVPEQILPNLENSANPQTLPTSQIDGRYENEVRERHYQTLQTTLAKDTEEGHFQTYLNENTSPNSLRQIPARNPQLTPPRGIKVDYRSLAQQPLPNTMEYMTNIDNDNSIITRVSEFTAPTPEELWNDYCSIPVNQYREVDPIYTASSDNTPYPVGSGGPSIISINCKDKSSVLQL